MFSCLCGSRGTFSPGFIPAAPAEQLKKKKIDIVPSTHQSEPYSTTKPPLDERQHEEDDRKQWVDGSIDSSTSTIEILPIQSDGTITGDEYLNPQQVRRAAVVALPVDFDEDDTEPIPCHPKDPADVVLIEKALKNNEFLHKIFEDDEIRRDIIDAMYNREIKTKEVIIKEGEKGSHMFVSFKGKYEITIKGKGVVSTFDDVRVFGELAILYNDKRLATIKATKSGRVWVLDRSVYQKIMMRSNIKKQDDKLNFLRKVDKLNVVDDNVLQKVASLLREQFYKPGAVIIKEGDRGDKFYIIRAGTVTISKEGEGVVGHYKKGDYFGELALLQEDTRKATVIADPPGIEVLFLERSHFIEHFGEVDKFSSLSVGDDNKGTSTPSSSVSNAIAEYEDVELSDLKVITTLGLGGFGRVELVQHTSKPELVFALKYLKKFDMVEQHQQEHVYNEKKIQMACRSMFIIRLYRTYRDSQYLYFLMESCLGGDLWTMLQKQKTRRFEEKEARFIAACVIEAFAYLHDRGIVYRDLKPENLIIDKQGYIKLTDFGFAKKLGPRGKTFTFAGTPEYVAPEIVQNRGHDKAVDYWEYGILIFELFTGRTPFKTNDSSHMRTYSKILSGIDSVNFPQCIPHKAQNIIKKLCKALPSERLGCQKEGVKDIRKHPWFMGFDWAKLNDKKLHSSFKPKLKSEIDTQYFEDIKKDNDNPPAELSGWDEDF